MAINMKELAKLTKFARRNGITSLKMEGVEIQFHTAFLQPKQTRTKTKEEPLTPQYTDEEILNWSSTSYVGN